MWCRISWSRQIVPGVKKFWVHLYNGVLVPFGLQLEKRRHEALFVHGGELAVFQRGVDLAEIHDVYAFSSSPLIEK